MKAFIGLTVKTGLFRSKRWIWVDGTKVDYRPKNKFKNKAYGLHAVRLMKFQNKPLGLYDTKMDDRHPYICKRKGNLRFV
jgi:hypothetical protein